MEVSPKVLSKEEKRRIINFTLDNLAMATTKGILAGTAAGFIFRSSNIGWFVMAFMVGHSLRYSNDYIVEQLKENKF